MAHGLGVAVAAFFAVPSTPPHPASAAANANVAVRPMKWRREICEFRGIVAGILRNS